VYGSATKNLNHSEKKSQNHIITAIPIKHYTCTKSFYRDSCNILYLQKTLNIKLCYSICLIFTYKNKVKESILPFVVEVN